MATEDRSRSAFYPGKHYAGVRMQQGRVLTDDDYNEGAHIQHEDQRLSRIDVIGGCGSPDQGFTIDNAEIIDAGRGDCIDFEILPGTFYVGGVRLSLEARETFRLQKDWLNNSFDDAPAVHDSDGRIDLVYLEVWQQPVSAVEDEELFEVALGGPDTATRLRTMRRVRIYPHVETDDCTEAWEKWIDEWATGYGRWNPASHELEPDARLRVGFERDGDTADLCSPFVTGGYLGAENQTIRVQLVDPDHFTWGFDNGAPLYRVSIAEGGRRVTLQTDPKDPAHWPKAGQIVEILAWSAVLPNGEKLAEELMSGYLSRVASDYTPETGEFVLSEQLPDGFGQAWQERTDRDALRTSHFGRRESGEYFFVRVWDRGSDRTSEPAIPLSPAPVALGHTGLHVTLSGSPRRAGDYWIIAARPETPDQVLAWELETQRPPDGIRRFYAPLALIQWRPSASGPLEDRHSVHDCRKTFRPLTEIQTCCTYTVGDGTHSHGDFTSVQAALNQLPASGGEICLLPGEYEEHLVLDGQNNVTIHGCGRRTKLQARPGEDDPVILIRGGSRVTIHSLAVSATTGVAIEFSGEAASPVQHVTLRNLDITVRDRSAILGRAGRYVAVVENRIGVESLEKALNDDPSNGQEPAVFIEADDLRIERNRILGPDTSLQHSPRGGIQIAGGADRVLIRRNEIVWGTGNGITLGSVGYVPQASLDDAAALTNYYANHVPTPYGGSSVFVDENGCLRFGYDPEAPEDADGNPLVPISDGALSEVHIVDNDISGMGANGIGVARFFELETEPDFITVNDLRLEGNRISDCLRLELSALEALGAYGGISLADGASITIRNNVVKNNGRNRTEPVCGIFILNGEAIDIDGNSIIHNGLRPGAGWVPVWGQRGGIVIGLARPRTLSVQLSGKQYGARQDGAPAVRIHNNVVVAPEGRALRIGAFGPVAVEGNQLTAQGSLSLSWLLASWIASDPSRFGLAAAAALEKERRRESPHILAFMELLGGSVVSIVNLGVSTEIYLQFVGSPLSSLPEEVEFGEEPSDQLPLLANGNILFNNNQIVYDALNLSPSRTLSVVTLLSLDDISMTANQCDCDLLGGDLIGTNALVLGWSVRVANNRFKESLLGAGLSACSFGVFNSTTHNQGSHCFMVVGHPNLTTKTPNAVLREMYKKDVCAAFDNTADRASQARFGRHD